MIDALRVVQYSLRDLWDEFVWLVLLNVLWSLTLVLPLVPFFVLDDTPLGSMLIYGFLLALPLPLVSGALCYVANQVSRGRPANWGIFVLGLRRYWAKSLAVAGINLVVLILIAANLQFYGVILQGAWTAFAFSAWVVVGAYWLLVQVFWFPMVLAQAEEKVLLALRNALAMVVLTPGFSLVLGVLLAILGALSVLLSVPLVVFAASLFFLVFNHATRSRLAHVKKEPYRPGAADRA